MRPFRWAAYLSCIAAVAIALCAQQPSSKRSFESFGKLAEPERAIQYPRRTKPYDVARGGVQIVEIAPDQDSNRAATGIYDEWITLRADRPRSIARWMLDAGDGQRFILPDSIFSRLVIYTHEQPHRRARDEYGLHRTRGQWIWNNVKHDTARIFDGRGTLVDGLTY